MKPWVMVLVLPVAVTFRMSPDHLGFTFLIEQIREEKGATRRDKGLGLKGPSGHLQCEIFLAHLR